MYDKWGTYIKDCSLYSSFTVYIEKEIVNHMNFKVKKKS